MLHSEMDIKLIDRTLRMVPHGHVDTRKDGLRFESGLTQTLFLMSSRGFS